MVGVSFQEAAVEVLDILEHTNKKDVKKIPENFITFLKENSSKTYVSKLDHSKAIKDMELKPKTEAILGLIYMKYWADEKSKKAFENKIKANEEILSKEEKVAFESNMFKEKIKEKNAIKQQNFPKEYKKENWFSKIIDRVKNFLWR